MEQNQIIIYRTPNGETAIDLKIADQTIWLTLSQISALFNKNKSTISRHLNNIYEQEELKQEATVAKNATVQIEGNRRVERTIEYYNLDAVISVGYRVNSKEGTQFRIWANNVLKEYLLKGYAINEKRLKEQAKQLVSLKNTVNLLSNVLESKELSSDEATGLLKVVTDYAYALDVLDKYDHQQLTIEGTTPTSLFVIDYVEAMKAIHDLKDKFGGSWLFGNEKDESFKSSIGAIYQTFGGDDFISEYRRKGCQPFIFRSKEPFIFGR